MSPLFPLQIIEISLKNVYRKCCEQKGVIKENSHSKRNGRSVCCEGHENQRCWKGGEEGADGGMGRRKARRCCENVEGGVNLKKT